MMNTDDEIRSSIDVIRCVYLARMAQRQGNDHAAERWQAKADDWLRKCSATTCEVTLEPRTPAPGA